MLQIVFNSVMASTAIAGTLANAYLGLINPYAACGLALIAGYIAARFVESIIISRARSEMARLHGKDWT